MNTSQSGRDRSGYAQVVRRSVRWAVVCAWALAFPPPLAAATLVHRPICKTRGGPRHIVWSARENESASVQYSTDASFSLSAPMEPVRTFLSSQTDMGFTFYQYRADLTGLAPALPYSYQVIQGGQNVTPESDYRFSTPGPGRSVSWSSATAETAAATNWR